MPTLLERTLKEDFADQFQPASEEEWKKRIATITDPLDLARALNRAEADDMAEMSNFIEEMLIKVLRDSNLNTLKNVLRKISYNYSKRDLTKKVWNAIFELEQSVLADEVDAIKVKDLRKKVEDQMEKMSGLSNELAEFFQGLPPDADQILIGRTASRELVRKLGIPGLRPLKQYLRALKHLDVS